MKHILLLALLTVTVTASAQSDPLATAETRNLFRNLLVLQQQGLMFGHQDALAYGNGWYSEDGRSDVKDVCGDYPGVYGWELGHLEQGHVYSLDSVYFDRIRNWIITAYERGGMNTVSWHGRNPLTGGSAWDVSSREVVASILPGGEKHDLYVQYLDRLAAFFLSLKTGDGTFVPVFFRPYHEHTGSWFWWGKNLCTPEQYIALWRFTITYFRDVKNIHHLLYAYSTDRFETPEEYNERYPGDDIIDMVAFDLYDRGPEYSGILKNCASIVCNLAAEKGKLGAVSEAGGRIAVNTEWWTKTVLETLRPFPLSYILVWRNPWQQPAAAFAPYKDHPSSPDFVKFYNEPHTLFQEEVTKAGLYK
ncbi:MAG TPA: glycosyl hydrolase [Bacteroidales bacterium]|nr:glycosyl hydrolase [Bacteroidales bacterium]